EERGEDPAPDVAQAPSDVPPIVGLLDGMPVQNHQRLRNRLVIDDPDDFEQNYITSLREHGTEMASLILHGDLNRREPSLSRPIYVRPVLRPTAHRTERTPSNILLVDLIHRAVRRMKEGEGEQPPTAPSVVVVNFSLGDQNRPFAGPCSPLAKLLDFLAFKYR